MAMPPCHLSELYSHRRRRARHRNQQTSNWTTINSVHALMATATGAQVQITAARYGTVDVSGTAVTSFPAPVRRHHRRSHHSPRRRRLYGF